MKDFICPKCGPNPKPISLSIHAVPESLFMACCGNCDLKWLVSASEDEGYLLAGQVHLALEKELATNVIVYQCYMAHAKDKIDLACVVLEMVKMLSRQNAELMQKCVDLTSRLPPEPLMVKP